MNSVEDIPIRVVFGRRCDATSHTYNAVVKMDLSNFKSGFDIVLWADELPSNVTITALQVSIQETESLSAAGIIL